MNKVPSNQAQEPYQLPIHYFVPNQFLLLIEHNEGLQAESLQRYIGSFNLAETSINRERILTFERGEEGRFDHFSLVPVEIQGEISDDDQIEVIERFYRESRKRKHDNFFVRSASPNWLASTAQGQMVTGGPGTMPVPPNPIPPAGDNQIYSFRLATSAEVVSITGVSPGVNPTEFDRGLSGEVGRKTAPRPVEIALLDTVPPPERIREAFAKWHYDHPLIESLLSPNGTLPSDHLRVTYRDAMPNGVTLFEALENEADHDQAYGVLNHVYEMSDHGLFAAGIAHTLAPQASIHLVEVLSKWGVGTTETLALGLNTILNERRSEAVDLIINCSLTIQFPWDTKHAKDALPRSLVKMLNTKARRAGFIERVMLPIRWILEAFQNKYPNVLIVAAAGNDGRAGNSRRPLARYPAAFPDVIGAGALKSDYDFAPYTNQSDLPLNAGIATFGGDTDQDRADAATGMLGIYIGEFPDGQGGTLPNDSGWGRWAGTSFAAPVISGVLAARIGMGEHPDDAHTWIEDLLIEASGSDNIFPMKQGT